MLTLTRCSGSDPAFVRLTEALDRDLGARYGERMDFFGRYNHSADVACALVARLDGEPAGCGCFKPLAEGVVEIKRVFVSAEKRKKGIARAVLDELESWAARGAVTSTSDPRGSILPAKRQAPVRPVHAGRYAR